MKGVLWGWEVESNWQSMTSRGYFLCGSFSFDLCGTHELYLFYEFVLFQLWCPSYVTYEVVIICDSLQHKSFVRQLKPLSFLYLRWLWTWRFLTGNSCTSAPFSRTILNDLFNSQRVVLWVSARISAMRGQRSTLVPFPKKPWCFAPKNPPVLKRSSRHRRSAAHLQFDARNPGGRLDHPQTKSSTASRWSMSWKNWSFPKLVPPGWPWLSIETAMVTEPADGLRT